MLPEFKFVGVWPHLGQLLRDDVLSGRDLPCAHASDALSCEALILWLPALENFVCVVAVMRVIALNHFVFIFDYRN